MDDKTLFDTMELERGAGTMFCCGCGETVCEIHERTLADLIHAAKSHRCVEVAA